jgi:hypothetical protein
VLIEASDGERIWNTVGSSTNIIEASFHALVDSLELPLARQNSNGRPGEAARVPSEASRAECGEASGR